MNVLVENQPNCLVSLQVELPADRVTREWQTVAEQFQRNVRIPGYRPGKAPKSLVDTRFAKDIKEELTNRLLRESLNEAIKEKNIQVISVSQVENVEIGTDNVLRYRATVVTAPDFELPTTPASRRKSPSRRSTTSTSSAGSTSSASRTPPTPRWRIAPWPLATTPWSATRARSTAPLLAEAIPTSPAAAPGPATPGS